MDHKQDWRRNVGTRFRQLADAFEMDQKHPIVAGVTVHEADGSALGNRVFWFTRKQLDRIAADVGAGEFTRIDVPERPSASDFAEAFLTSIAADQFGEMLAADEEVTRKSWPFEFVDRARTLVIDPTAWAGGAVERTAYPIDDQIRLNVLAGLEETLKDQGEDETDKSPAVEHGDNGSATAETETAAISKPGAIQDAVAMASPDPKPLPGRDGTFPDPDEESATDARVREDREFEAFMKKRRRDDVTIKDDAAFGAEREKARRSTTAPSFGPADVLFLAKKATALLIEALSIYRAMGLHVGIVTAGGALLPMEGTDRPRLIETDVPNDPQVQAMIARLHFLAIGDGANLAAWLELDDAGKALKVAAWSLNRFPLDIGFKTLSALSDGYREAMFALLHGADAHVPIDAEVTVEENASGRFVVYQSGVPKGDLCRRHTIERAKRARDEAAPNHKAVLSIRDSWYF